MSAAARDWFDAAPFGPVDEHGRPRVERGLRFSCTMCGNCCTGAPGTVALEDADVVALSNRLGLEREAFVAGYTKPMDGGLSLNERLTAFGWDCVFLDRTAVPGKAVCGVYEDRPLQCRTWPFWKANLASERAWASASRTCPGMNRGRLHAAEAIRVTREGSPI
ncbi:MAG: YkgJ family cysteine cluster protein [Phycisphaerales bacterium]|jgi:Fe-S-cluster containining protein